MANNTPISKLVATEAISGHGRVPTSKTSSVAARQSHKSVSEGARPTSIGRDGGGHVGSDGGRLCRFTKGAGPPLMASTPISKPSTTEAISVHERVPAERTSPDTVRQLHKSFSASKRVINGDDESVSSGKLALPVGGDADGDEGGGLLAAPASPKKGGKARGAISAHTGPGGKLNSGARGVPAEAKMEHHACGGVGDCRGVMVTTETQTEDNIREAHPRGNALNLMPWAKRWVLPLKPEILHSPVSYVARFRPRFLRRFPREVLERTRRTVQQPG